MVAEAGKVPNQQSKLLAEVQKVVKTTDLLLVKLLVTNKSILEVAFGDELVTKAIQELEVALAKLNSIAKIERMSDVLIAIQAKDPSNSLGFVEEVRSVLAVLNSSGTYRFLIEASIGAVVTDHTQELDAAAWFTRLNLALMKSTRSGRPELASEKLALSEQIRHLLSRLSPGSPPPEGMHWVFQPINHVDTGEIYGYEALCRWEVPELGPVSPDMFIQIAEGLNLAPIIDFWTLRAVDEALPELVRHGGEAISINLSAQTVGNDHKFFFAAIELLLPKLEAANFSLIFELTETSVIENQIDLTMGLFGLRQRGALLAIDDFGTGKTSLSIISSLPTDFVKLDGSLIEVKKPALRRGLLEIGVKFAQLVGAEVIVEKVETEAELEFAREVGAKFAQGWYFGQPLDFRPDKKVPAKAATAVKG